MKCELAPALVAQRLAVLGASYVAETVEEGRRRLREAALQPDVFAVAVARRLEELRALDELTRYLHQREADTTRVGRK